MKRNSTRRKTLALIGTGLTGVAGLSGISSAQRGMGNGRSREEIIEQSYKILERTGEREKRVKFLENHGLETSYQEVTFDIEHQSDGVGTQEIQRANIELGISISKGWFFDRYTVGVDWRYTDLYEEDSRGNIVEKWGMENPYDILAITWDEDWWNYDSLDPDETLHTSEHVSYRDGTFTGGPAFNIDDDADDGAELNEPSDYNHASVDLVPIGDYEPDERKVSATYFHNYRRVSIESVSVSWDSVSVSVSNNTYQNIFDQDESGDFLRVFQSDI